MARLLVEFSFVINSRVDVENELFHAAIISIHTTNIFKASVFYYTVVLVQVQYDSNLRMDRYCHNIKLKSFLNNESEMESITWLAMMTTTNCMIYSMAQVTSN